MDAYGLSSRDMAYIVEALKQFSGIEQALIFGSRAKGTHKIGSDVDLALKGNTLTYLDITRLSNLLNETLALPYFFDLLHYETLDNAALVAHIDRAGKLLYSAESTQMTNDKCQTSALTAANK